jgi:hypothetical protein
MQGWTLSWPRRESSPISGLHNLYRHQVPAVSVTDLEMALLYAQITGNDEAAERRFSEQLARSGDLSGLAALVYAAFVIAARRKFGTRWSRGEVIRYVAQVRALLSERPALLDPLTAEDELRSALGEPIRDTHKVGAVAAARLSLLLALMASLDLDDEAVANLLGEARDVANRMLESAGR